MKTLRMIFRKFMTKQLDFAEKVLKGSVSRCFAIQNVEGQISTGSFGINDKQAIKTRDKTDKPQQHTCSPYPLNRTSFQFNTIKAN